MKFLIFSHSIFPLNRFTFMLSKLQTDRQTDETEESNMKMKMKKIKIIQTIKNKSNMYAQPNRKKNRFEESMHCMKMAE